LGAADACDACADGVESSGRVGSGDGAWFANWP